MLSDGLVKPRKELGADDKWRAVLDKAREPYTIKQLRAVIRRYPSEVAEAVREFADDLSD